MFLPPSPVTQYYTFTPYSAQPLSPLNPNARAFYPSMSSSYPKSTGPSTPNRGRTNVARRGSKFDTLTRDQEEVHERRRGAFLRGVRERGEERRGMVRAELSMRSEFLERRKAWEEEQKRRAEDEAVREEEEEDGNMSEDDNDAALLEYFVSQEERELEAMTSSMTETERSEYAYWERDNATTDYGSDDDEEYRQLLLDELAEAERQIDEGHARRVVEGPLKTEDDQNDVEMG